MQEQTNILWNKFWIFCKELIQSRNNIRAIINKIKHY